MLGMDVFYFRIQIVCIKDHNTPDQIPYNIISQRTEPFLKNQAHLPAKEMAQTQAYDGIEVIGP